MKKLLMNLVKYINHFTNSEVSAEDEANTLWNYMQDKKNPLRTLHIFEAFENRVKYEMQIEKEKANALSMAINTKWVPEAVKPRIYDPNYDLSLNELQVRYTNAS